MWGGKSIERCKLEELYLCRMIFVWFVTQQTQQMEMPKNE